MDIELIELMVQLKEKGGPFLSQLMNVKLSCEIEHDQPALNEASESLQTVLR